MSLTRLLLAYGSGHSARADQWSGARSGAQEGWPHGLFAGMRRPFGGADPRSGARRALKRVLFLIADSGVLKPDHAKGCHPRACPEDPILRLVLIELKARLRYSGCLDPAADGWSGQARP